MKNSISTLMALLFSISALSQIPDSANSASKQFKCDASAGECSIQGTSTLHDWESEVENFTINAVRVGDQIEAQFKVVVESIKSGHSGMDRNTYKALKMDQYPDITFSASDLQIEEELLIKGFGNLTIAGVTKRIPVSFSMTTWLENTMTITGKITINMRDYGVEPPVALLGTVKTGEEIVFVINTTLNQIHQ